MIHVPTFEEFVVGRKFKPATLKLLKEAWNAALVAADHYMQENNEGIDYGIVSELHVE